MKPWTAKQLVALQRLYPTTSTKTIAKRLKRSVSSIYNQVFLLGLKKDPAFIAEQSGKVLRKVGKKSRFKAGHRAWNAGKKCWQAGGRAKETQFKKGNRPQTWKPLGTERTNKDGDVEVKVAEPNVWKTRKQVIWEEQNGPVPSGKILRWVNGKPELIDRAKNMELNTVHRYPRELKFAMRLAKRLNREIERHEKRD